jgi:hypothetical protein
MFTATSTQRWPTYSDVEQDYGIAGLHSSLIGAPDHRDGEPSSGRTDGGTMGT